ncbi:1,4-alpha-glucan branching protein GlgB [Paenibacillus sp. IB182496]|uniref:1,4-alpha-glucan branching enzyme GlgB n=1 Tax=Paenibacillus sabuli TaxID=2772509 RepID=A0A927GT53_9BACL|nr:1,4-alpha-glucan branching protein GlgB [Paenibacillus sabuli]MBD2847248.1 1,4-alpha-glucan branching protein GlgB [Paenibacillus sabuli]
MVDAAAAGLTESDLYLFNTGRLYYAYRTLGAHMMKIAGKTGVRFAVWAPEAGAVRVAGAFNDWDGAAHPMEAIGSTGVWWCFVPGLGEDEAYKYEIETPDGRVLLKADPYAFFAELRPSNASIVKPLKGYPWKDTAWMKKQRERPAYSNPMLIYEVHLGSWKIKGKEHFYTYEELAEDLVDYAAEMGYSHIELLPLTEHPFDRSWGYQATGYYAPTSRYGEPDQLRRFVDRCHQRGLGVILDWVPGHFCRDDHGLRLFDGTPIYEGPDERRADKPQWGTLAFDFGRGEVLSFLISGALYWMEEFHMDGLRVDAVASMVDLHFDKPAHLLTWNAHGGQDYLEAIDFLKALNTAVFRYYPGALMIAEDSSSRPGVTAPVHEDGLGFNFKWNMGWMNDMLRYMALDPAERGAHHHLLTFSLMYAFNENFVLPLSHDEVVHGKHSLLNKMHGSYEQRFAQLRLFFGFWMTHPGKKLLFMGGEWGHYDEWKDLDQLDWAILRYDSHQGMQRYSRELNRIYRSEASLWEQDCKPEGFEWLDVHNAEQALIAFLRRARDADDYMLVVCNFSGLAYDYRLGVPEATKYRVAFRSSLAGIDDGADAPSRLPEGEALPWHGRDYSLALHVLPFECILLKPERSLAHQ